MLVRRGISASPVTHFNVRFPAGATKTVSTFFFFFLFKEKQEETRDPCALYVFEASSQRTVVSMEHPGSAVSAALSSYYRQQVQMVKGRCSEREKKENKKKRRKKKKKEQAPGPSVVAVWGCSHYD